MFTLHARAVSKSLLARQSKLRLGYVRAFRELPLPVLAAHTASRSKCDEGPCSRAVAPLMTLLFVAHLLHQSAKFIDASHGRPMILISFAFGVVGTASVVGSPFTNAVMCGQ